MDENDNHTEEEAEALEKDISNLNAETRELEEIMLTVNKAEWKAKNTEEMENIEHELDEL